MRLRELFEGVVSIYGRKGTKTVRKYRCTTGARKGRIVAKASTCTAPRNVKKAVTLKHTKRKKSSTMQVKSSRTKRSNPASLRLKHANTGMRRAKPKSRSKHKRMK